MSAVGIPIGLIFGYLAGFCMSPSLTADAQISAQAGKTAQTVVSANPLIFFAAALLTLLTVYLSCLRLVKWWKSFACGSPTFGRRRAVTEENKKEYFCNLVGNGSSKCVP